MEPDDVSKRLGFILSTSHELTENILRRLNFTDLISATKVCSTWRKIGYRILKRDRKINYTMIHPYNLETYDIRISQRKHQEPELFNVEPLDNYLNRIPSVTSTCLGFTNGDWLSRNNIKRKNKTSTLYSVLKETLHSSSRLSLLSASGVIGTAQKSCVYNFSRNKNTDSCSTEVQRDAFDQSLELVPYLVNRDVGYNIEVEEAMNSFTAKALSLLTIPDQPGVKISVIRLNEEEFQKKFRNTLGIPQNLIITPEEFNSICNLKSSESLKALLIFYCEPPTTFLKAFKTAALNRQSNLLAMGGGLIRSLQDNDSEIHNNTTAIAFSGKNVTAATVIVPRNVKTIEKLEIHLSKFKEFFVPKAQSMCFMFACCGRGRSWYSGERPHGKASDDAFNPNNLESRTFLQMFPTVPLFGFFGEGEFGLEYLPLGPSGDEPNPKRRKKVMYHQFTTIFVMVSIL